MAQISDSGETGPGLSWFSQQNLEHHSDAPVGVETQVETEKAERSGGEMGVADPVVGRSWRLAGWRDDGGPVVLDAANERVADGSWDVEELEEFAGIGGGGGRGDARARMWKDPNLAQRDTSVIQKGDAVEGDEMQVAVDPVIGVSRHLLHFQLRMFLCWLHCRLGH